MLSYTRLVNLYNKYSNDIKKNIETQLKKFNVNYAIKDKKYPSAFRPDLLPHFTRVYDDENFAIYKIN